MPSGFYNGSVMFADNVRFDGAEQPGQVTTDGQLLIGSTVAPNIRVSTLTAGSGISITNGSGTITIGLAGSLGIGTINGDTGSITGSTVTIYSNNTANNAGGTVKFVNSGTTSTLNVSDGTLFNTFIGSLAGKTTTTGNLNTAFGYNSMNAMASGLQNDAFGADSLKLNSAGIANSAFGRGALLNTTGSDNTAVGNQALTLYAGSNATAVGSSALLSTTGAGNTALGYLAGRSITTGTSNVAIGFIAMVNGGASANNVAIGYQSLQNCTGSNNVAVGYNSGASYNTTETNNLILGANILGTAGESNITRLGGTQTQCYVAGIASVSVSNALNVVINSSTGQLGTIAGNAIQEATLVLTNAQIKALNATPIQIIAAPGAGKAIIVMSAVGKMTYGTNIFVAALNQGIALAYNTTAFNTILTSVDLVSAASVYAYNSAASLSGGALATTIENVAVKAYNPIGTEITGNAANDTTITLVVKYYIVTI
jgi:hypothetical protein